MKPIQVWNRIWRKRLAFHRAPAPCGTPDPLPEFAFLNTTAQPQGWNDPRMEKLWLYNLHYFDYLDEERWRDEVKADNGSDPSSLVARWIDENPEGWGNGWEPYPISLRVVNWVKWLEKSGADGEGGQRVRQSLVRQMRWLEKRLEYHLLANHLLANAKALVFAGAYLKDRRWYEKGMAIYRRQLPEQTCADGVNFERSPMYHCIILEDLLDCYEFTGENLFAEHAEKMIAGLKLLTGPDGKIAKFNDSAEGIAKQPSALLDYAKRLGLNVEVVPSSSCSPDASGYVRKEAGAYVLLAKCGEIGPSYQPGHAHADTFSFELWRGQSKIVGDTGCSTYVPGAIRSYERSTAAHNTVVIDGRDSSEVWAAHRVGRRFDFGRHRRTFGLTADGLRGTDEIRGRGVHDVELRFHLPTGVDAGSVAIDCPGERLVAECDFAVGWNRREKGICLTFRQRLPLPAKVNWSIR